MNPLHSPSSPVIFTLAAVLAALAAPLHAADKITYNDNVLPIFRNACLNCHNPDKKKAGLDLSTYAGTLAGGETGPALLSGNAAGSLLFKCVKQTEEPKMPPKGDRLNDAELAVIEKWILGQLLETATGKAVAASNNKVDVAVVSLTRPDGPPPMPGELPLEPVVRTRAGNALTALAVSPWAPLVAIGGQKQIVLYNIETLEPLGVLPFPEGFPAIIKFSRNGQLLMTGGGLGGKSGKVALWDIKTGDRIGVVGNEFDQVLAADLSADQQFVALGGPGKLVKIYATKDGKLVTSIKKHTEWISAIAYSPDGRYLASADRNGGVMVWEGATGKEFNALPGHKVAVTGLAFMTGVLASSSEDGKISLWDVKEGKEIRSWNAHGGGAAWVDFTPDGRLVSCGRDKIAKVWDQQGKQLGASPAFPDIALRAALSNDRIIAGDWTGSIRVCSFDGKPLGELSANPPTLTDRIAAAEKRLADASAALPALQQQVTAIEQKLAAENAALEAAKALPAQLEKRLAEETAQLAPLTQARDAAPEAERPAAQQKIDVQNAKVAATKAEFDKAKADLLAKTGAPAAAPSGELAKKLEQQNAEVTKLREVRATKKEGSPEFAAEDAKVQAKKAEIAATQAKLAAAPAPAAPAAPKPSPAVEELAKAKAALDPIAAQIAAAKAELDRWKLAQHFQVVHNSKRTLLDKQAQFEGFVQAAKEALAPVDKVNADIAAAEKAAAEAPAKLKAAEDLLAAARATAEPLSKAVGAGEAALAEREKTFAAMTEAAKKAPANADELAKKLAALTADIEKRRAERATKTEGTPEYVEANAKVQALKPELAAAEAALAAAKTPTPGVDSPEVKAALAEVAKAKDALVKARADAKDATDKLAVAEKAFATAKTASELPAKQLADFRAKAPGITKTAQAAKVEAERAAAAMEKELAAAKADADKRRTDYEAIKGAKSAAVGPQAKL